MPQVHIKFDQRPAIAGSMIKALVLPRKGFDTSDGLPDIQASWLNAQLDLDNLKEYQHILGLSAGVTLPILYPHVMAGGMHMQMLTHKSFPIRLLGAVHLKNRIIQHKPMTLDQNLDIHSAIACYRLVSKGLEFDFSTNIIIDGKKVWEEVSTYFLAGKFGGKENPSEEVSFELVNLEAPEDSAHWHVPKNRGRKYAKITGDYNPIHMSPLLAKLFGLKRDIAHGFGILAEAINHTEAQVVVDNAHESGKAIQVDVVFKGPIYLDSQVNLKQNIAQDKNRFDVYCGDNPKPSICCAVTSNI